MGICLGSFVKALADRSVGKKSFLGRSYCPKCKKQLKWYDLFPVFSYLSTLGRCRYCKTRIGIDYLLTEVVLGILVALILAKFVPLNYFSLSIFDQSLVVLDILFKIFAVCVLSVLFITDYVTGFIYDRITYPAIIITFGFLLLDSIYRVVLFYFSLKGSILGRFLLPPYTDYFQTHALDLAGQLFSGLVMAALVAVFFGALILVTRGRGMGGGDLKLGLFLGLILGFPSAILALLLSFVLGSVFGLGLIILRLKHFGETIPFGPFLSLGGVVTLLWGQEIINWYLKVHLF